MTHAHVIEASRGDTFELGNITMKLLVGTEQTNGAFALGEFAGGEGTWTVPHTHQNTEESFYVLEGSFIFTVGDDDIQAGPGTFVLVQRSTKHVMRAEPGGGRFLTLWTPGGLEAMFVELSRLPADSMRDLDVRKAISARFDSIPA
jgi:quercetin dioxygenase-like cupin family protein